MIPQLWSLLASEPLENVQRGATGTSAHRFRLAYSMYWGQIALLIYTFGWLVHCALNYETVALRPEVLFGPEHWYGRLFMQQLPPRWLFYSLLGLAAMADVAVLVYKRSFALRILLTLLLLWVNLPLWSYGFASHVSHLFLLAHVFGIFVDWRKPQFGHIDKYQYYSFQWYLLGVFATYTMSGLWKWIGLLYKFVFQPDAINWLHPDAALLNAVVSFRNYDLPLEPIPWLMETKLLFILGFFIVLYIQTFSFLGAFRQGTHFWLLIGLIVFHVMNIVAFHTVFYTAPAVVTMLLFPYHWLPGAQNQIPRPTKVKWIKDHRHMAYTRVYPNGEEDTFQGFNALRERWMDINPALGGLLSAPLVRTVTRIFWVASRR
jgi:hypothetical protein